MVEHERRFSPEEFAITFYPVLFSLLEKADRKYNGNKYIKSFYCDEKRDIRGYSDISFEMEENGQVRAPIRISVSREVEDNHFYIRELTITETRIQSLAVRRQIVTDQEITPKFRYVGRFDPSHLNLDVLADWIEEAEAHIDSGIQEPPCEDPKSKRLIVLDRRLKERIKGIKLADKKKSQ